MSKIDEAAILKRAKELCAQNGSSWDVVVRPVVPGAKIVGAIDDVAKKEYLAKAKEQLLKERGE
jgi:hypothetical protein